ncbi:aldo/keto reductase [Fulvimarina sp. 2208YS6-2-32]|uniref:Aldo/keto reductase n=1 Tax=Fulvimarina uroteuthidis TaxID=3098149 RepID=A0ABU5I702_9HYPH|nr:aldo/keto reductase [Fulvimarina sp. 2208YS6-2-32]MDY8110528.1 aldo/keto reductase [Fulvimarina sp. 2208YS6-2-32]
MRTVEFADGLTMSVLGQGTWRMGEDERRRESEIAALRLGVDLGMTTIDTAEMYGSGRSESLVGEAIAPVRDDVCLVSKVLPSNASYRGTIAACERSLERLGTDRLDLYLLHWSGSEPVSETVRAFERLKEDGKIRNWGVSNLDRNDIETGFDLDDGLAPVINQLYYSLEERGIEFRFLDWMRSRGIGVMAYTPLGESGTLRTNPVLGEIAARHGATPAQIALAFALRQPSLCTLVKASSPEHVRENAGAADIALTSADLRALDAAFPPPDREKPLAMI